MGGIYHSLEDLPGRLAVFPLSGGMLLPRGVMPPITVFEPRYLEMVDAALAGNRLIGMIQPVESEEEALKPQLAAVGCAGRLTGLHETEDGRYVITLTGICRFAMAGEAPSDKPYRLVNADFAPFLDDLTAAEDGDYARDRLLEVLQEYLDQRTLAADWKSVLGAPPETLVNALAMLCPFAPAEKQALLEAPRWTDRADMLVALMEMANRTPPGAMSVN